MAETNPYNANQYQMDPRQKLCWGYYIDPRSETFSNGYKSALKAGFEDSYALVITTRPWFEEKVLRGGLLSKAEKVFDRTLNYEPIDSDGNINVPLLAVQVKVATTVATTQGKDEGYSTRTEQTGPNGGPQEHVVSGNSDLVKEYEEKLKKRILE